MGQRRSFSRPVLSRCFAVENDAPDTVYGGVRHNLNAKIESESPTLAKISKSFTTRILKEISQRIPQSMDVTDYLEKFSASTRESDRPIGFLLGAGCAKSINNGGDPLIPDTKGMTRQIEESIRSEGQEEKWESILEIGDFDPADEINVEDILSLVRDLRPHAGDGEVRGLNSEELEYLENKIREEIIRMVDVDFPTNNTGYHSLTNWVKSIDRDKPVEVFTTNYDLLVEKSFENRSVPFFEGFVGGFEPFFDSHSVLNEELPTRWTRLWKIHGSINWKKDYSKDSLKIKKISSEDESDRAVIHPSHMKYDQSRKMPYLAYLDRLDAFLNKPDSTLFINGYSFGDQHLNEIILDGLRGPPSSQVFALMYSELDSYPNVQQLASREGDLSILAKDAGMIGTKRHEWKIIESDSPPENDTIGLEWNNVGGDQWKQTLTLGDFQEFGNLLESVIGR